jgi:hypothetical protein
MLEAGCATYIGGLTGTPTVTFTDSGLDSWSTDISYNIVANSNRGTCLAHAVATAGGNVTVTMTYSQSFGGGAAEGMFLAEYSGATTFDKSSLFLNTSVTSFTSGSTSTTSNANELLVGTCNAGVSETWTAGTGYTIRQTDTASTPAAFEDQIVSSTGAYAATMTGINSTNAPCVVAI